MTQEQSPAQLSSDANELLTAMVELVGAWSSLSVQAEVARRVGLDINEGDVRLLYAIGRLGEVRPNQLAEALHITRPTASKSLTRLGAAGFTARRPAADDRRGTIISLTALGQETYGQLITAGADMVKHAYDAVPEMHEHSKLFIRFTRALRSTHQHHPDRSNT